MSAGMDRDPQFDFLRLTQGYCDDTLQGGDRDRLERRLLADAGARAEFRRYLALDAALRDYGASAAELWRQTNGPQAQRPDRGLNHSTDRSEQSGGRPARSIKLQMATGLVAAVAACVAVGAIVIDRIRAETNVVGALEQVTGEVLLFDSKGRTRAIDGDAPVREGDTLQTRGAGSSTLVVYPDGTRLTLFGDTSLTCGRLSSGGLNVRHGTIAASVQPQPSNAPMTMATPAAELRVLGTQFTVEAAAERTDLRVSQGRVRLVRVSDFSSVDVPEGKRAVVTERHALSVEDIPELKTTWDVDFEDGLPPGWRLGEHVTQGLPKDSRGAVKAVRDEGEDGVTYYGVSSQSSFTQGLFAVRPNSRLRLTFKMEHPRWLNVFLVTRDSDPRTPKFAGNFLFKEFPKIEAGQWMTASIPLAQFKPLNPGNPSLEPLIPFHVIFNSTAPDRGLVIDRIWVTPDGPNEVRIERAK